MSEAKVLEIGMNHEGPDGSWVPYKKVAVTHMVKMAVPFRAQSSKGDWSHGDAGDYLAGATGDYWAVLAKDMEENYERAG